MGEIPTRGAAGFARRRGRGFEAERRATAGLLLAAGAALLAGVIGLGAAIGHGGTGRRRVAPPGGSAAARSAAGLRSEGRPLQRVGARVVTWRVLGAYTAARIANAYLPPVEAAGRYVVVDLAATNGTGQALTLAAGELSLAVGGARYPVDATALAMLELGGHRALPGADLAPGATATGWVVFDVSRASSAPRLCFEAPAAAGPSAAATCLGV